MTRSEFYPERSSAAAVILHNQKSRKFIVAKLSNDKYYLPMAYNKTGEPTIDIPKRLIRNNLKFQHEPRVLIPLCSSKIGPIETSWYYCLISQYHFIHQPTELKWAGWLNGSDTYDFIEHSISIYPDIVLEIIEKSPDSILKVMNKYDQAKRRNRTRTI